MRKETGFVFLEGKAKSPGSQSLFLLLAHVDLEAFIYPRVIGWIDGLIKETKVLSSPESCI